jgi:Zn-dependent protease
MELDLIAIVQRLATFFPSFLLALTFHEFSHAFVAARFGDRTAAWGGRLTLNPVAHIDPLGTIMFPLINVVTGFPLLGWAKPVPVDPRQFSSQRAGMFWVSFAGPLSNFLLGFLSAFLLVALLAFVPQSFEFKNAMKAFLEAFIQMNFVLALFNLLPIPPLDGSQMLLAFLPYNIQRQLYEFWDKAFFLLFFLMLIGAFRFIFVPLSFLYEGSISLALLAFGLT